MEIALSEPERSAAYVELIDSWYFAVPYDPHFVEGSDSEKTQELFINAWRISQWMRKASDYVYETRSFRMNSRVERLLLEVKGGDTQQRNGCEPWQAFLTVTMFARITTEFPRRRFATLSIATTCAQRCLAARMGRTGFVPWLLSAETAVQVTQVDSADDTPCGQFAQQCIRSLVRRALRSYAFMCEAHRALALGVEAIDAGHVSKLRAIQLHGALGVIEIARRDLERRMVIVIQGLHARLGCKSPFFLLGTDITRCVVELLKESRFEG